MENDQSDADSALPQDPAGLRILYEAARLLESHVDLSEALPPLLKLVADRVGGERVTIALIDAKSGELRIEEAHGLSVQQKKRGVYKEGEGITGLVFQTGEAIIVEDVAGDRRFLDRTGARGSAGGIGFACVPISVDGRAIGTLSADFPSGEGLHRGATLLRGLAGLVAESAKLRKRVREDEVRSIEEREARRRPPGADFKPRELAGTSDAMRQVYEQISQVAGSGATVLVTGESGTGKELVAREIHYASPRAEKPFITVNCAALPESVIESELFGHEKGSFTGAVAMRKGRFELADSGSLFLDEIGEISPAVQVKLLRALQEREIDRVGGVKPLKVDVRIIAATNRDLYKEMKEGRFREDLFYRLNVFPIHVPPLRERKSDILLLADLFCERYSRKNGKDIKRISSPAIDLLASYHWPGNVRELENCIERAVIMSGDGVIHAYHMPPTLQSAASTDTAPSLTLPAALAQLEREMLVEALKIFQGNMSLAAKQLGITERQIGVRMEKYQLNYKQYRSKV
jgi:Nif-specific regulatory protein